MNKLVIPAALMFGLFAAAYGDSFPVGGTINGSFESNASYPTLGTASGGTWDFVNGINETKIVYNAGPAFGVTNIPPDLDISLGSLTMTIDGKGAIGNGNTPQDILDINVVFSTPTGGLASFMDLLTLNVTNGNGGDRILISDLPSPQSFTIDNVTYTVTFDGMFDAGTGGADITQTGLFVRNGGNTGTAYLRGTISAEGSIGNQSAIPEPGSVGLLLTVVVGVAFSLYRKRLA